MSVDDHDSSTTTGPNTPQKHREQIAGGVDTSDRMPRLSATGARISQMTLSERIVPSTRRDVHETSVFSRAAFGCARGAWRVETTPETDGASVRVEIELSPSMDLFTAVIA